LLAQMTIFLAVLSTAASASTVYLFAEEMRSRRRFGWKQVTKLVKEMLTDMRKRGYTPDLVLGVGRGGSILAGMLAGNMGHLPLAVLDTVLDHPQGVSRVEFRFPDCCPTLRDKKVLIVVGELYSGEDLRQAIEFVQRRHPREIKTASLLTHPAASVHPDFIGFQSAKPLSAPWRMTEAYKVHRL
jgi:hypoxanthine phosphoribosyltransferase